MQKQRKFQFTNAQLKEFGLSLSKLIALNSLNLDFSL